ncbi:hypothetical protein ES288_D06G068800v1 [Gossypium darwinii]|uniref:Retrovirus-related Pol polyprotein from transposon TNT 1-94-like beta-barrel domain-containing protein n=1 Tax=Gossypium darwinii TaxID=34276 RepID=A0A5D2C733_GOSDA|nr:hypothetical protein ES288_D06G068800v1 [Gossypium darwinii]
MGGHTAKSTGSPMLVSLSTIVDPVWNPNSGATTQMTSDSAKLSDARLYNGGGKVIIGNGLSIPITYVGGSTILANDFSPLLLNDLLYVPDVGKNLLSVFKFAKDNSVFFEFYPNCCYVNDLKTYQTLLCGNELNGCIDLILLNLTSLLML